jgi:hypothetical protein
MSIVGERIEEKFKSKKKLRNNNEGKEYIIILIIFKKINGEKIKLL